MENYTIEEIARIARQQGLEVGKTLKGYIEAGIISPDQKLNILIPIGEIKPERFSLLTRVMIGFGSTRAGVVSNSVIMGMGVYEAR